MGRGEWKGFAAWFWLRKSNPVFNYSSLVGVCVAGVIGLSRVGEAPTAFPFAISLSICWLMTSTVLFEGNYDV